MKQYLFIILLIITITVFFISYNTVIESLSSTSSIVPDQNIVNIDNSESLRDLLGKVRYIVNLDENRMYNNIKPNTCYKISTLCSYFDSIKDFLDISEEEIMAAYGPEEQEETFGQPSGPKPPIPIIGSNYDYYNLILLSTYMKMLKPYNDLGIWVQNDNKDNPSTISSSCNLNDNTNIQFVKCAKNILTDIKLILSYFQYQTDTTNIIYYGDGADTGTGDVPKE